MADTHLGYREGRGTINKWAVDNYTRPYEQDIYDAFLKVMEDVSKIDNLDYVVHCGDIFHHPHQFSSYTPPEPARKVLRKGLELFFNNTQNKVPLIYVEGNHGIFRGYEYTPFESHVNKKDFPELYYFKQRDLIEAIKEDKQLTLEFKTNKVRFYLFPYFEFKGHESYKIAYDKWILNQKPPEGDKFINIAIAHGSKGDDTLHKKVSSDDFEYDYIALGHEHILKQESKNRYYAGCLLPLNFKERYQNQGYLMIDIKDNTKELKITKINTDDLLERRFESIEINISPNETTEELTSKIMRELDEHLAQEGFNPKTSARLKLNFQGEMTYEKTWQVNDLMSKIRRDIFSQSDNYNILQLIWFISDISDSVENDVSPGFIEDFILENPDEEFGDYVSEKLSEEKSQYNVEKLTMFGMDAIKNALKSMDRQKEV